MMSMMIKKVLYRFCGSSVFIDCLDTYGKTRSITDTSTAQTMSIAKSFFCPAIYDIKTFIGLSL